MRNPGAVNVKENLQSETILKQSGEKEEIPLCYDTSIKYQNTNAE